MSTRNLHHGTRALAPLALVLVSGPALGAEAWRCSAPTATAYRHDPARNRWTTLVIPVTDQDFHVQRSAGPGESRTRSWEVRRTGDAEVLLKCPGDFDAAGVLRCGPPGAGAFEMNRNALTFTSHVFGASGLANPALTAATVTGTCRGLAPGGG